MSPRKRVARKPLPGFGVKGALGKRGAFVRAFLELGLVRIQWTENSRRKTESWRDTSENRAIATAFAEGVAERLRTGRVPQEYAAHSVRDVYDAFLIAETEHLRPTSLKALKDRFRKFETFVGASKLASAVTRQTLDKFRAEMKRVGHAGEQIARHVQVVKQVYEWAVDRDLIAPTKVTSYSYKRSRDDKPLVIPEYAPREAKKMLRKVDPRSSGDWRLYVAIHLFAFAGPRQNAARHLEWRDVDFSAGTVRWRPELDKLGYDRTQPLPPQVMDALWVAYGWRGAYGYQGKYILFRPGAGMLDRGGWHDGVARVSARSRRRAVAKPDQPWTYSAFNGALRRLEERSGVPHIKHRAAHGFRRYVINEVNARTGNLVLAGQYVGDKDLRTLMRSYVRERPEELARAVTEMERSQVPESRATRNADATGAPVGARDTELIQE
jgi:integrase